jgi:hypothetical protein
MSLIVTEDLDQSQWRLFVENHPEGNIFHTPEFFQVLRKSEGYEPILMAAVDENDHIQAIFNPVIINRIGGIFKKLSSYALVFGGVLPADGNKGQRALSLLLQTYEKKIKGRALLTEIRNVTDQSLVQPLLDRYGYKYEDHLNYINNLKSDQHTVFRNFGARLRKQIRREIKKRKVHIEEVKNRDQVSICYNLLRRSYRNARIPFSNRDLFQNAFSLLHPKGMILFTLAYVDATPVATSVDLIYKNRIYGWYGGVNRDYSAYVPNEMLTWYIFQWGMKKGLYIYDFGGAGKPGKKYGVRDFKSKFGGELVCFGRNTNKHNPIILALSKVGYEIYRRIS